MSRAGLLFTLLLVSGFAAASYQFSVGLLSENDGSTYLPGGFPSELWEGQTYYFSIPNTTDFSIRQTGTRQIYLLQGEYSSCVPFNFNPPIDPLFSSVYTPTVYIDEQPSLRFTIPADYNGSVTVMLMNSRIFSPHEFCPVTLNVVPVKPDRDGDHVPDDVDLCPDLGDFYRQQNEDDDDGDGLGNGCDPDRDGDGLPNDWESETNNHSQFTDDAGMDFDGDGLDGLTEYMLGTDPDLPDTDGDRVLDDVDEFPNDPVEWNDADGDGVGDNADDLPYDASETADTDGDGVGDNGDHFPNDPAEWTDSDGDGVGNNSDAFPGDPGEILDGDGDGVGDNSDIYPENPQASSLKIYDGGGSLTLFVLFVFFTVMIERTGLAIAYRRNEIAIYTKYFTVSLYLYYSKPLKLCVEGGCKSLILLVPGPDLYSLIRS